VVISEHPNDSTFYLHPLACFAEEKRRQISERSKTALSGAKIRGFVLGKNAQVLAKHRRSEKLVRAESLRIIFEQAYLETGQQAELLNGSTKTVSRRPMERSGMSSRQSIT
jgi:DNA invertase Pin-like site-specific DNA recombinase